MIDGPAKEVSAVQSQSLRVAVLTCMDIDFDVCNVLSLRRQDADIVTNPGGVATADALHDLSCSQWQNSTSSIIVLHHTRCSVIPYTECFQKVQMARNAAGSPDFPLTEAVSHTVRATIEAIIGCASILHRDSVVGYTFDDALHALRRTN